MMKRIPLLLIACLVLLSPVFAQADTLKIGIVDLMKALNESDSGKRAKSDLESLVKVKESSIEDRKKNIEKLKADLDKQSSIISAEARKSKEAELERLIRDFQRIVTDSEADLKKKQAELTGDILKELREIITKIGEDEKFSLVLEQAEGLVLYNSKALDITDRVIVRYNDSKKK